MSSNSRMSALRTVRSAPVSMSNSTACQSPLPSRISARRTGRTTPSSHCSQTPSTRIDSGQLFARNVTCKPAFVFRVCGSGKRHRLFGSGGGEDLLPGDADALAAELGIDFGNVCLQPFGIQLELPSPSLNSRSFRSIDDFRRFENESWSVHWPSSVVLVQAPIIHFTRRAAPAKPKMRFRPAQRISSRPVFLRLCALASLRPGVEISSRRLVCDGALTQGRKGARTQRGTVMGRREACSMRRCYDFPIDSRIVTICSISPGSLKVRRAARRRSFQNMRKYSAFSSGVPEISSRSLSSSSCSSGQS
jgi:hypothetical protein